MSTESGRTHAALAAREAAVQAKLESLRKVVTAQADGPRPLAELARLAGVSRAFLYQNPDARSLLVGSRSKRRSPAPTANGTTGETGWQQRALNAEAEVARAHDEISVQRLRIADLLGKVQDLECDLPADGVQRLVVAHQDLRRQLQASEQNCRRLEERLTAARENARFLDRRVADLEIKLLDAMRDH